MSTVPEAMAVPVVRVISAVVVIAAPLVVKVTPIEEPAKNEFPEVVAEEPMARVALPFVKVAVSVVPEKSVITEYSPEVVAVSPEKTPARAVKSAVSIVLLIATCDPEPKVDPAAKVLLEVVVPTEPLKVP